MLFPSSKHMSPRLADRAINLDGMCVFSIAGASMRQPSGKLPKAKFFL